MCRSLFYFSHVGIIGVVVWDRRRCAFKDLEACNHLVSRLVRRLRGPAAGLQQHTLNSKP